MLILAYSCSVSRDQKSYTNVSVLRARQSQQLFAFVMRMIARMFLTNKPDLCLPVDTTANVKVGLGSNLGLKLHRCVTWRNRKEQHIESVCKKSEIWGSQSSLASNGIPRQLFRIPFMMMTKRKEPFEWVCDVVVCVSGWPITSVRIHFVALILDMEVMIKHKLRRLPKLFKRKLLIQKKRSPCTSNGLHYALTKISPMDCTMYLQKSVD